MVDASRRSRTERQDEVGKRGAASLRSLERFVLLDSIDEKWKDMLYNMDQLRDIVGMRSFAQQDPKLEYKRDATELFQTMMDAIDEDVTTLVFRMSEVPEDDARFARRWQAAEYRKDEVGPVRDGRRRRRDGNGGRRTARTRSRSRCASRRSRAQRALLVQLGKKYKKCHWPTDENRRIRITNHGKGPPPLHADGRMRARPA
jgi:preprotein translocase subunit SecA